jgi:hypothetical protein
MHYSMMLFAQGTPMGHQRLNGIPKTRKWNAVVEAVTEGGLASEKVTQIAALTLEAAKAALADCVEDPGLRYTFYLLTQIVLTARYADWRSRIASHGIQLNDDASVFDLVSQVQGAVDDHLAQFSCPTDVSELAQQAAGDALARLAAERSIPLFASKAEALQVAMRELSTPKGFARLGQNFFARFLTRFLDFYLSRITSAHTGEASLPSVVAVSDFNRALERHCDESSVIVRDFCGGWYGKTEYLEGITPHNTGRFMAVALAKLRKELARQGASA